MPRTNELSLCLIGRNQTARPLQSAINVVPVGKYVYKNRHVSVEVIRVEGKVATYVSEQRSKKCTLPDVLLRNAFVSCSLSHMCNIHSLHILAYLQGFHALEYGKVLSVFWKVTSLFGWMCLLLEPRR